MSEIDYALVFVISLSTGIGTTFGAELAKEIIGQIKARVKNKKGVEAWS